MVTASRDLLDEKQKQRDALQDELRDLQLFLNAQRSLQVSADIFQRPEDVVVMQSAIPPDSPKTSRRRRRKRG